MKIFKQGFSLAELLLSIGIIAIITALGMTITKQATEKAYRGYWYTGYINLYNAIGDFNQRQLFTLPANDPHLIHDTNSMARELRDIFNATGANNAVIARNGIIYTVTNYDNVNDCYAITMSVPQARTRENRNGRASADLSYFRASGLLVPSSGGEIDLQNRRDLLPTYYDTGVAGNRIQTEASRQYSSYNQTYCNNHSSNLNITQTMIARDGSGETFDVDIPYISCEFVGPDNSGIIRVVNPAKVR